DALPARFRPGDLRRALPGGRVAHARRRRVPGAPRAHQERRRHGDAGRGVRDDRHRARPRRRPGRAARGRDAGGRGVTRDHDEEETAGEEAEASSPLARRMADAIADHADRTHAGGDEPPDGDDERAAAGEAGDEAEAPEAPGDEAEAPEAPGDGPPLATVLEAVLFAAAEPVPLGRLTRILFPWTRAAVAEALAGLATELAEGTRGVRLV